MNGTKNNPKKPVTLESLSEQIGNLGRSVDKKIDNVAGMVKHGFDAVDKKLQDLEIGQEDIKLRLDQAAWRFEVDALDKRVKVLEDKAGIVREKR
ncbi:MAG: hypothetical protein HY396_00465 [Candidatus Doudnabacteria bacterium]|nr:hypothetical protein [Candidatus Doudnabacteria bacterium]